MHSKSYKLSFHRFRCVYRYRYPKCIAKANAVLPVLDSTILRVCDSTDVV
uniref:Uncharacterized protein n=1 Tax=Setaria viridis TaxID=4556 RepID=A0A4U6T0G1_SETVI|nr:hypothetical protein SEVIR_9G262850v2 [Setaria viridis]